MSLNDFDQVCAILVKEPYNKSFAEIAKMTDQQIAGILFMPSPGRKSPPSEDAPDIPRPTGPSMSLAEAVKRAQAKGRALAPLSKTNGRSE